MNALDFLADFAALLSTSAAMTMPEGGHSEHDTSITQLVAVPAQTIRQIAVPPRTGSLINTAALDDWIRYNPTSSAQFSTNIPFSKLESLFKEVQPANTDRATYDVFNPPPINSQGHPGARTLNTYLQADRHLYCGTSCSASYQHSNSSCDPTSKASCSGVPAEKEYLDSTQSQFLVYVVQPRPELPIPEQALPFYYPCQGNMCHCRYLAPQSYCVADGTASSRKSHLE